MSKALRLKSKRRVACDMSYPVGVLSANASPHSHPAAALSAAHRGAPAALVAEAVRELGYESRRLLEALTEIWH